MNTNKVWQCKLEECLESDLISYPRGMEVRELLGSQYRVDMPAFITIADRKVNYNFMFAEAWWILSGSNRVSDIDPYMKFYKTFSDDGVFMRGAYGPKIVDQLGYVVDTLSVDIDSRQAVLNIWRERPGMSKDIPCTLSLQFIIRDGKLNCIATMRSNDIVKGFTYDVFTFSMVSYAVLLLLRARGVQVALGELILTAGSLHLYQSDYEKAEEWINSSFMNNNVVTKILKVMAVESYDEFLIKLKEAADEKA